MLIQSTIIKITSKRSLKSYAGVDLDTCNILRFELATIENERLTELSNKPPNRLRQSGGGKKQSPFSVDGKLLSIRNILLL